MDDPYDGLKGYISCAYLAVDQTFQRAADPNSQPFTSVVKMVHTEATDKGVDSHS